MASTPTRKRKQSPSAARPRRVGDLTTDELRGMIEQLIERKLEKISLAPMHASKRTITGKMRERATSAAGRFHSGFSDISSNHDDFLTTDSL